MCGLEFNEKGFVVTTSPLPPLADFFPLKEVSQSGRDREMETQ